LIFTGGIMAAPFIQSLPFEKNKIGQIVVNGYLRPKGAENVFIVGDAADLKDKMENAFLLLPKVLNRVEQLQGIILLLC